MSGRYQLRRYAPLEPEVRSAHPSAKAALKVLARDGDAWDAQRHQTSRGWYVWDTVRGERVPRAGVEDAPRILSPYEVRPKLARMRRRMPTVVR